VNPDRQRNLEYIRKLEAGGVSALFITVDAPQLGRREKDMRMKVRRHSTMVLLRTAVLELARNGRPPATVVAAQIGDETPARYESTSWATPPNYTSLSCGS
jgi:isopentenyl diphosphate isomerase/L-lactate dehydrogenase-like FMN-dependent dehydrogenase